MTVQISPAAELNLKNDKTTAESIEARISNVKELIDNTLIIYENQVTRVDQMDQPETKQADLLNGPWGLTAFAGEETREVNGSQQRVTNNRNNSNSVWDFIFTSPIKDTYYALPSSPGTINTITNPVADIERSRYDTIFREHVDRINIPGGVKDSITNAVSQLNNLNTVGYQAGLTQAKEIIVKPLISELVVLRNIINAVSLEINNPQSLIYKPGSSFGTYTTASIAAFQMPPLMLQMRDGINALLPLLTEIYTRIDELVNIPEDVLTRVSLLNAGLEQSPTDPSQFNLIQPQEKDPWGIRFTYNAQQAGNLYAKDNQVNTYAARNGSKNGIGKRNTNERERELQASRKLLAPSTINLRKDYYFQLLPAIKSNLPVSGGTDVPGAMPGIQFRIENNIVKHQIPGFSPIYQPIGIDSIKCTLVGMFTGSDGVDLSANYLEDLSAGLLNRGQSLMDLPFVDKNNYSLAKGGPTLSTFDASNNPFTGEINPLNNPVGFNNGVDLPIPSQGRSTTASPVAVISEDAFRGAQDFYNEIVAQGREVEVELNLRKGTGAYPGGSVGPFRDPETGNPKFKGLIRRVDLYYVRRDRCWFIIDLEITDSGLIGKECLNLTNIIEESVELFEGVTDPIGLTKEQLDKCFKAPLELPLKGDRSGEVMVIDTATGLSYFYSSLSGNILADRQYPLSFEATMAFLYTNRYDNSFENLPSVRDIENTFTIAGTPLILLGNVFAAANVIRQPKIRLTAIMLRLATLYEPTLTSKENDFAINLLPSSSISVSAHGTSWRYNKNTGTFFYVYEGNKELVRSAETSAKRARTLKDLLFDREIGVNDAGGVEDMTNFLVQEYVPLLKVPENDCSKLLDELTKEAFNKQDDSTDTNNNASSAGGLAEELQLNPNSPNTNLQETSFTTNLDTNKEDFVPQEIKEGIENGLLNRLLSQALTEYLKVLDQDSRSFVGTALTKELNKNLQDQSKKGTLYTKGSQNSAITLVENRTRVFKKESSNSEMSVYVNYTQNKEFYLFQNNKQYKFEPTNLSNTAKVLIKPFIQNGIKVYKVDSVILFTGGANEIENSPEPVKSAPANLEPSANNSPSVSVNPN